MTAFHCDCGDESFVVSRSEYRRSSKERACEECDGRIKAGDRYQYTAGLYDGGWTSHYTCERCSDLVTWMRNNIPCFCWMHGNLHESVIETADEASFVLGDEVAGLRFGARRRLHAITLHNRRERAS